MIKIVGILLLMFSLSAGALVPVEGIIMGEANRTYQNDPLSFIFRDRSDLPHDDELIKAKFYRHSVVRGMELTESCNYLSPGTYTERWREVQAKRSFVSGLQYIGLDTTVKAIGSYAKILDIQEDSYKKMTENLVRNYCSKNLTVISLRNIQKSLEESYANPLEDVIPSLSLSPYVSLDVKNKTESLDTRKKEFEYIIKNFRAFCSWGGSADDYRMLAPYLKNPFVMGFVIESMSGLKASFDQKSKSVVAKESDSSVQVACKELICREMNPQDFEKSFPLSSGSTGVNTDLKKIYCGSFREMDIQSREALAEVKAWIKSADEETFLLEANVFLSLLSGVPDLLLAADTYQEAMPLVKSYTEERWNQWANNLLSSFSQNLLYEESLKVKALSRDRLTFKQRKRFTLDFSITMGELDRLVEGDKMKLGFNIHLSKNYIRYMRSRWDDLARKADLEGQGPLKEEFAKIIDMKLQEKEKLFAQPLWNKDFSRLIVEEIFAQILAYEGDLFDSYKDEMLDIPIKFTFGNMALGYLRYRSDVRAQRLKLNL